eukprot:tig00020552_g10476.t1
MLRRRKRSERGARCPCGVGGARASRGAAVALLLAAALAACAAQVADPALGVDFGTTGGFDGPRAVVVPALTFTSPLTLEFKVKVGQDQELGARLVDFGNPEDGTKSDVDSLQIAFCPSSEGAACGNVDAGKVALRVTLYQFTARLSQFVLFGGADGIPADGTWHHVAIAWSAPATKQAYGYLDGTLRTTAASEPVPVPAPSARRTRNFIGSPLEWVEPRATGISLADFRLWGVTRGAAEIAAAMNGDPAPAAPGDLLLRYKFDDCGDKGPMLGAVDSSGAGLHASLVDDARLACPDPAPALAAQPAAPSLLAAAATGPVSVSATIAFTAGQGVAEVELRCSGFGGPAVARLSVADADAPGAYVTVAVAASYGNAYPLSCTAVARTAAGLVSPASSPALSVVVPSGMALAAQAALMPAGNPLASNTFLRVGTPVASDEAVTIAYAVPLPNYLLGQRPSSHRLGLITQTRQDVFFCDYDLDACRCTVVRTLSGEGARALRGARPVDFAYASLSPYPPKDPDARFPPHRLADAAAAWHWSAEAYAARSDLIGPAAAGVLQPPASCESYACYTYAAQRWAGYAFSGCNPEGYGPIRPFPPDLCATADPYDFMAFARNFSTDFRHFRAAYERTLYEAASGLSSAASSETYEWAGLLGALHLYSPEPAGENANASLASRRTFRVQPELLSYGASRPDADPEEAAAGGDEDSALGPHYPFPSTNCLDFYDAEPTGRTFEGGETMADVRRAYGGTPTALLLQDTRYFTFWGRGSAFFGSFLEMGQPSRDSRVVPLLKACSLGAGVALLKFDLAAVAPAGTTPGTSAIYQRIPWPGADGSAYADSFPPGASVQAVEADGRVAEGGPLLYHAIVRVPFFPAGPAQCASPLVGGVLCPGLNVTSVTAIYTWEVNPASFADEPVGAASSPYPSATALSTYRTGVVTHGPPKVLRTDSIPLSDHWIVQNERPLHTSGGYGYLEGRFVDPPNGRYAFYVTGDQIIRIRKANSYQSGMAGEVDGTLRIYGGDGWTGSRREWTSVAAAAYKDGTLYVVREVHTPENTRIFTLASETETRPRFVAGKRLRRSAERAPSSQLLRIVGVDSASFAAPSVNVSLVVPRFPANIISAHVVDDYSSGRMLEADPALPFSELPWVIFVISAPPMVIKMHTRCPAGQRWNWEAAVFNRSVANVDLCVQLPAGRYSPLEGLLLDEDAPLCPAGNYSAAGSTACSQCEKGTWADGGAAGCYDCPQHTYANETGMPCTPCPENLFTTATKWTFQCAPCLPGSYLPRPGDSNCITCPSNAYSGFGALYNCSYCPLGEYPTSDLSTCAKCKPGEYQPSENVPCIPCPPGRWSSAGTFGNCSECTMGREVTDKQDGCQWCRPGYYVPEGEVKCFLCPEDSASSGGEGCRQCGPGFVSPDDRLECRACPPGTFEDVLNANATGECTPCPLNSVAPFANSTACDACAEGYVSSPDSTLCLPCNSGTYRSAVNASCEPVPRGAAAPAGSPMYTRCVNGTVPNGARSECVPCGKGTYKVENECQRCPLNTIAFEESREECTPCRAGEVASADSQTCIPCPAGMYRGQNMSACEPVPLGSAALEGSAEHTPCGNGSVPNPSRSECVPCPKGSFAVDFECQRCSLNEVASAEGMENCTACPPGTVSAADFQTCVPCPAGTYRMANMSTCEPVPAESVAVEGSEIYTVCLPGWVPNTIKTECVPCRKGSYELDGICRNCPLNAVSPFENATECIPCPPGTVATADLQTCVPCGVGTYRGENMTNCTPVPSRAVALEGSPAFTPCPNGSIANGAKSECIACRAGSYQRGELCLQCPLNHANPVVNQTECSPCPDGYVAAADSQTCVPCLGGYYRNASQPICHRVPAGAVALPGSGNYTQCPRGWVPNQESTSCQPCEKGTYETEWACRDCVGNTHQPEAGQTFCTECAAGSVASEDRQGCDPCPSGSFRNASMSYCQLCPFTTYSPAPGAFECDTCRPGTQSSDDRTGCDLCLAGFYEVNGTCTPCSDGSISAIGSTSCQACEPGAISSVDRTECIECPGGTYKADGTNLCLPCLTGSWSPPGTAGECFICPLGWYASFDSTKCLPCDAGTYMRNGTLVCVQCPALQHAPNEGTASRCLDCDPGYVPSPDSRSCYPCPLGFFRPPVANDTEPVTSCVPCPTATVARTPGTYQCSLCPPGKVPREDRAECRNCSAGLVPRGGFCALCPAKHISVPGDANCTLCPPGRVSNEARTECLACPAASYLPPNSDVCLKCAANTISQPGSVGCTACDEGDVADETQTFCKPCARGTYRNSSMAYCEPCPTGTFASAESSSECLPCTETQLCPVATADPIEIPMYRSVIAQRIAEVTASAQQRRSLRGAGAGAGNETVQQRRRRLAQAAAAAAAGDLGASAAAQDASVDYLSEDFEYDTNAGTITRAEIKTEEVAVKQVYRLMAFIAAGTGGVLLVAGLCILAYLRVGASDAETKAARVLRVKKLDFLYKDVVAEKKEERKKKAEAARASAVAVDSQGKELGPALAAPAPAAKEEEDAEEAEGDDEPARTVTGAVFAVVGLGLVFIAVAFVLLQYVRPPSAAAGPNQTGS